MCLIQKQLLTQKAFDLFACLSAWELCKKIICSKPLSTLLWVYAWWSGRHPREMYEQKVIILKVP